MPLRALLRYLMHNEQLIQSLADSAPMRRAAQFTAYLFQKGQEIGEEQLRSKINESGSRIRSFKQTFMKEMQEGMKQIKQEEKKR